MARAETNHKEDATATLCIFMSIFHLIPSKSGKNDASREP